MERTWSTSGSFPPAAAGRRTAASTRTIGCDSRERFSGRTGSQPVLIAHINSSEKVRSRSGVHATPLVNEGLGIRRVGVVSYSMTNVSLRGGDRGEAKTKTTTRRAATNSQSAIEFVVQGSCVASIKQMQNC